MSEIKLGSVVGLKTAKDVRMVVCEVKSSSVKCVRYSSIADTFMYEYFEKEVLVIVGE